MKASRGFRNSLWGLSFLLFLQETIKKATFYERKNYGGEEIWKKIAASEFLEMILKRGYLQPVHQAGSKEDLYNYQSAGFLEKNGGEAYALH
jgi:hypothetical protein